MKEAPRITVYGRLLDNKTQAEVRGYQEWRHNTTWNYGEINGNIGGESPYIVELDVWNNEPSFSGLSETQTVADATNCRLTVWDDDKCITTGNMTWNGQFFMNVRCVTKDQESNFQKIAGPNDFADIYGNVNITEKGILHGDLGGDHSMLQTKIVLPMLKGNLPTVATGDKNFVFALYYEFE